MLIVNADLQNMSKGFNNSLIIDCWWDQWWYLEGYFDAILRNFRVFNWLRNLRKFEIGLKHSKISNGNEIRTCTGINQRHILTLESRWWWCYPTTSEGWRGRINFTVCGHQPQGLAHRLPDRLASKPLRRLILVVILLCSISGSDLGRGPTIGFAWNRLCGNR